MSQGEGTATVATTRGACENATANLLAGRVVDPRDSLGLSRDRQNPLTLCSSFKANLFYPVPGAAEGTATVATTRGACENARANLPTTRSIPIYWEASFPTPESSHPLHLNPASPVASETACPRGGARPPWQPPVARARTQPRTCWRVEFSIREIPLAVAGLPRDRQNP